MNRFRFLVTLPLAFAFAATAAYPAMARPERDQDNLRKAAAQGEIIRLDRLVAEVQARQPYRRMTYLGGPQFDASTMRYALRFLDGKRMIIVYVDARTGRIVGHHP